MTCKCRSCCLPWKNKLPNFQSYFPPCLYNWSYQQGVGAYYNIWVIILFEVFVCYPGTHITYHISGIMQYREKGQRGGDLQKSSLLLPRWCRWPCMGRFPHWHREVCHCNNSWFLYVQQLLMWLTSLLYGYTIGITTTKTFRPLERAPITRLKIKPFLLRNQ